MQDGVRGAVETNGADLGIALTGFGRGGACHVDDQKTNLDCYSSEFVFLRR